MLAVRWLGLGGGLLTLAGVVLARHADTSPFRYTIGGSFKTVAVDAITGRAFLVDRAEMSVRVLASRTGHVLETLPAGEDIDALAVDAGRGRVVVATRLTNMGSHAFGVVMVFDAHSGAERGGWPTGPDPDLLAVDAPRGQAVVVDDDSSVSLVDERSGAVRHRTWLTVGLSALAVDACRGRVIVVNGAQGTVSLLDARSGALLRTVWAGRSLDAVAVDARRGRAFVADVSTNTVSVLDTGAGRLLRRVGVAPNPSAIAVDERTALVFVASQGAMDSAGDPLGLGTLTVLDATSGRLIGTQEVGLAPTAIAVDERTGAVFVVTAGGELPRRDAWSWLPLGLRQRLPFLAPPTPRAVPAALTVLAPDGGWR